MVNKKGTFLLLIILLILQASSAWSATISGTVKIEGKKDKSGVLVTIQGKNLSGVTDKDGKYSIPNVPLGHFTLIAQKPGCLVGIHSDVLVNSESVVVDFQLVPGDLKIDNQINLLDRIVLASVWKAKEGDVNWNSMVDIYEDGVIDEKDRDLLLAGWRKGNPNVKLASLKIESNPNGASILINGADTGKITPYTFPGMVIGNYIITLKLKNYAPVEVEAPLKEDLTLPLITLDNQPPEFDNWAKEPANVTEDTKGSVRVSVRIMDRGGSGMVGKIPHFDYHIGTNTTYGGYKPMKSQGNDIWSYEIPEPLEGWDAYRGKYIYYKAKAEDTAGNSGESVEQQELIDDINDPPMVRITNIFKPWEKGLLTIVAEASDTDGTIADVLFEHSFDNVTWTQIGSAPVAKPPYSVAWDTKTAVQEVATNVWVRATATDDDNASIKFSTTPSFAIDNQPPTTNHDYDGLWHNRDFVINLKANDGNGIGASSISYRLNNGNKQDIPLDGQMSVPVTITKEDRANVLEYWSIDKLGNEEQHKTLSSIKLDKTAPVFSDWGQDPIDLIEDTTGKFRVFVRVTDEGSGLTGKIPQIDYSLGDIQYDGYENMMSEDGKLWYADILEPLESWNAYRGKYIRYKVRSEDIAGNIGESSEGKELIDDINDAPMVKIESAFNPWQRGLIKIEATASDTDGVIAGVQFEYSSDKASWKPIGPMDTTSPYSIEWDTTTSILQAQTVWLRAVATDNDSASTDYVYPAGIGIDNESPSTSDDYNDLWHKEDFAIKLTASDGNGIGVSSTNVRYRLNNGDERNVLSNGQPFITDEGIHQLEYWSIDNLGNTEAHHIIQSIKLDKTPPRFTDWIQDPTDLIEDSIGSLRVSVRLTDNAGSGLVGKIPQFSYRIGRDMPYHEYVNMLKGEASNVWYYDIPEPAEGWDAYRGKYIYYKAKTMDVAGNPTESTERQELIDDINDSPSVKIITSFGAWETSSIRIEATASDPDGVIVSVRFEHSPNKVNWTSIGTATASPYFILWDTKTLIPEVAQTVWIKATATDDDGLSVEHIIPNSFRIDNQPPTASHDYDNLWHKEDFVINLTANDKNGIGVASIAYRLNNADKQEVPTDGRVGVPVKIAKEGTNTLEYWSADKLGNEEQHKILTDINLDKTLPTFSNWEQDPTNLIEDTTGIFRVFVQVTDDGSGLAGKIPQIDYRIGKDARYDGYENMTSEEGRRWYFAIPEPAESWNSHRGEYVYYKVKSEDFVGNIAESPERKELIDSINDAPTVNLKSTFKDWEAREITLIAEASDADGSVPGVQFEYTTDNVSWKPIGAPDTTPPYSVSWDTKTDVPELAKSVWVRVTATDADDNTVTVKSDVSKKFGIDNQPPTPGKWTKSPENLTEDTPNSLRVAISFDDTGGSGAKKAEIAYRIGTSVNRGFREMKRESDNSWYYEIMETGGWDQYRGQTLFYKARATDAVDNVSPETAEQQELIDDINDAPSGYITSTYEDWMRGAIPVQADATDQDGKVTSVQFQYSRDNLDWVAIGSAITKAPYTVTWDSSGIDVDPEVWLKAIITDDDNASTEVTVAKSFGIDNKPPEFANWKLTPADLTESSTESFLRVEVEVTDPDSGLDSSKVQLSYRIGKASYSEYQSMFKRDVNIWFYEIPRPLGNWFSYAGQSIYYKVKASDKVGNVIESEEHSELIDPTTGSISGTITPKDSWREAKVTVQRDGQNVAESSVSQIDGSYSVTRLVPGIYNLIITAPGYGTDRSQTNIEVKVGKNTPIPNVELYTYTVGKIARSQAGRIEFKDKDARDYTLIIEANTFLQDTKVVLGFSERSELINIPNPTVLMLGKAIGVGFEGKDVIQPLKLIMPKPGGITDGRPIMAFIYDGKDFRIVNRNDIAQNDTTITVNIAPQDLRNFSDQDHKFDRILSKTADTVFYALITRFDEPRISASDLGIREPQLTSGRITGYLQPSISASSRKIALVIHGITSKSEDLVNVISGLKALTPTNSTSAYYDHVLVFNYVSGEFISSNSLSLMIELARVIPITFDGKIDVVAHDTGGLVARYALINSGGDQYIGSLTMLGTPNGGVNLDLLKTGFASFLKKTQSDPAWSYYRNGWQEIIEGSQFLASLNNQAGKKVNAYYYGIAASNPDAPNEAENNDGLLYLISADFTNNTNFPYLEQPLTEAHEKVTVTPTSEGRGFMSQTRHVAMLVSPEIREKILTYLRGKSENIKYERYDGELIPGRQEFKVTVKNVGSETVYGVSAKLATQSQYILKYSGVQGIEKDTVILGDIPKDGTKTGIFSFDVSPTAQTAIGQLITFNLFIRNSRDNSISIEEFTTPIGGNWVRIALDPSQAKLVKVDVQKDLFRTQNDGDTAVEPDEIMKLDITLENRLSAPIQSIKATLKTDNTRIKGLIGTTEIDMAKDGLQVDYGTLAGNGTDTRTFQFVKILKDLTLLGTQVVFTLDIKSGTNLIGKDEFSVRIGADILLDRVDVDEDLIPGGGPEDIDVTVKNITSKDIADVEVIIRPYPRVADIEDERVRLSLIRALGMERISYRTTIDSDFVGYVQFTLEIRVLGVPINTEAFTHYFGMRTQYITSWITSDGEGITSDRIAEPGETIKLQIARRNPTGEEAKDVEVDIATSDPAIILTRDHGNYNDISANEVASASREYEFSVVDDISVGATSGSVLSATRLELPGATWTQGAFIGRYLNPNTSPGDPQYSFRIVDNGTNWIDVVSTANMPDPDGNGVTPADPQSGDPFQVMVGVEGDPVEFTLSVEEDGELLGTETLTMQIGGVIRYLPPAGYDALMATISDRKDLDTNNNNGNGIPEPGETIEITVTLINITNNSTNINVSDVRATLDSDESDVDIDNDYDEYRYGTMTYSGSSRTKSGKYRFTIDKDIEVNKIPFILSIEGKIDNVLRDLGTDTFVIPVKK